MESETFDRKKSYIVYMSKSSTLTIGVSVLSGALLAAWLLTGTRKEKTKQIITKSTSSFKNSLQKGRTIADDSETYYI